MAMGVNQLGVALALTTARFACGFLLGTLTLPRLLLFAFFLPFGFGFVVFLFFLASIP
jgi:hypothetical protein